MIDEIESDASQRMDKSVEALQHNFARIRTGRANPALLEGIMVRYYGNDTPLNQVSTVSVEDARTLVISPWEKNLLPEIAKAILRSDLGINPATSSDVVRVPLPALTEESRKELTKVARHEAEQGRVSVRNIRRDAINDLRELLKEKEITEDEERKAHDDIQKITDGHVAKIDAALEGKEAELLEI